MRLRYILPRDVIPSDVHLVSFEDVTILASKANVILPFCRALHTQLLGEYRAFAFKLNSFFISASRNQSAS